MLGIIHKEMTSQNVRKNLGIKYFLIQAESKNNIYITYIPYIYIISQTLDVSTEPGARIANSERSVAAIPLEDVSSDCGAKIIEGRGWETRLIVPCRALAH